MADDYDLIFLEIGGKDRLSIDDLIKSAFAFKMARAVYPRAMLAFTISGYDDDPRELYDIPEAAAYIRAWAHRAGIGDWREAIKVPWEPGGSSLAMLQECHTFADDSPIRVTKPTSH